MISVDGLTVEFGGTTLFKDISFQINEKDRIALMGKNGAGKSTLLKILAGVRQATRGTVSAPKDCVIAYLPQHLMTEDGRTVFEETTQAFAHLKEIEQEIERLNTEMMERTDYESDSYMALIEKVTALSEKFYAIDMTHFEEDVEKTLLGLGFERSDFDRPTSDFSGGWRMRIELAKLLLRHPDVLLLDEPTNHLDIESKEIVEEALMEFEGTLLIVSHDRYLLNTIPDRILELTEHGLVEYKGKFDYYLEKSGMNFGRTSTESGNAAPGGGRNELELTQKLVKDSEAERKAKKQSEAEERRRLRRAESVENRIHEIEAEIADIQDEMSLPENSSDPAWMHEKASKMAELEAEVTELYDEWMELQ